MKKKVGIISIILCLIVYLIIGIKNLFILRYGILLITILSGASFISYIFKRKTEETIIISLLGIIAILYIFGLLNLLKYGRYVVLLIYNSLGIYVLAKKTKDKEIKKYINNFFTVGTNIFIILYIVFAITTFNKIFTVWDEYTYWSIASKNMYYSNSFLMSSSSTVAIGIYPPNPTVLQYFFCKVIGMYSQGIELFTLNILGFAFLIDIFHNFKVKNFTTIIATLFAIICIPNIFCDQYFYITIYADAILGITIGYMLYKMSFSKCDTFKIFSMIITALNISLIKSTGIIVLLILCFCMLIYYIANSLYEKKTKMKDIIRTNFYKNEIYLLIVMLLVGILTYSSWNVYTSHNSNLRDEIYKIEDEENLGKSYDGDPITYLLKTMYYACFKGYGTNKNMTEDIKSLGSFAYDFLDKSYYSSKPFNMSASSWIAITIVSSIVIYNLLYDKNEKKKFLISTVCVHFSELLYIIFLQVAYMLVFANREGIVHNSLQRYLGTYLLAVVIYLVFTFINYINNDKIKFTNSKFVIVACLIFVFTPMSQIFNATITSGVYNISKKELLNNEIKRANYVISKVKEEDKIYVINQTASKDSYGLRFRYFVTPIKTSNVCTFNEEQEFNNTYIKLKEELFNKYDYVYLVQTDEFFNNFYKEIFKNDTITEWTLYKINKADGVENVELIPVVE